MANAGLGVPVKLLHESLGHVITVELKTGQLYRGKLAEGPFLPFNLGAKVKSPCSRVHSLLQLRITSTSR